MRVDALMSTPVVTVDAGVGLIDYVEGANGSYKVKATSGPATAGTDVAKLCAVFDGLAAATLCRSFSLRKTSDVLKSLDFELLRTEIAESCNDVATTFVNGACAGPGFCCTSKITKVTVDKKSNPGDGIGTQTGVVVTTTRRPGPTSSSVAV